MKSSIRLKVQYFLELKPDREIFDTMLFQLENEMYLNMRQRINLPSLEVTNQIADTILLDIRS